MIIKWKLLSHNKNVGHSEYVDYYPHLSELPISAILSSIVWFSPMNEYKCKTSNERFHYSRLNVYRSAVNLDTNTMINGSGSFSNYRRQTHYDILCSDFVKAVGYNHIAFLSCCQGPNPLTFMTSLYKSCTEYAWLSRKQKWADCISICTYQDSWAVVICAKPRPNISSER